MTASTLIVGQAPAKSGGEAQAFRGSRSGERLASLLGIDEAEIGIAVETRNLLAEYPGSPGHGDHFDMGRARVQAGRMSGELARFRRVVLCGRKVLEAFVLGDMEALEWRKAYGTTIGYLPHPSGVSRWWNDPRNRERAREFAAELDLGTGLFDRTKNEETKA